MTILEIGTRLAKHEPSFVYILAARQDSDSTASISDLRAESLQIADEIAGLVDRMWIAESGAPIEELDAAARLGNEGEFFRLRQEVEARLEELEDAREAYSRKVAREEAIIGEIGRRLADGRHTLGLAIRRLRGGRFQMISTQPLCPAELIIFGRVGQKHVENTYKDENQSETFGFHYYKAEHEDGDGAEILCFACGTDYDREISGEELVDAFANIVPDPEKAMIGYVETARARFAGETRRNGRKVD